MQKTQFLGELIFRYRKEFETAINNHRHPRCN